MRNTLSITAAAVLLALSGLAGAQSSSSSTTSPSASTSSAGSSLSAPNFSEADKNNDGQVSRSEWDAYFNKSGAAGGTSGMSGGSTTGTTPGMGSSPTGSGSSSK